MAKNESSNYEGLERPYGALLQRDTDLAVLLGGDAVTRDSASGEDMAATTTASGGGVPSETPIKSPQSLSDVWIDTFIRSNDWKPKTQGFYIDGKTGYAEFSNVYVSGTISAAVGDIGGFDIGADYIRDAANSMGLASTVTGGDDIRFWAGDTFANRASAEFRVTESGALTASNATITGSVTATSGTIGGFSIGATSITATNLTLDSSGQRISLGSANDIVIMDADDATYRLWIGNATAASAPFNITKAGAVTASNMTVTGGSITGTLFRTAASGERIEMDTTNTSQIRFYNSTEFIGKIEVDKVGDSGFLKVLSGDGYGLTIDYDVATQLVGSVELGSPGGVLFSVGTSTVGSVGMYRTDSATEFLRIDRSGGVTSLITDLHFKPETTATSDLGTSSLKWNALFVSGYVHAYTAVLTDAINTQDGTSIHIQAPLRLQAAAADPSSMTDGTIYYDATNNRFRGLVSGTWKTFTVA